MILRMAEFGPPEAVFFADGTPIYRVFGQGSVRGIVVVELGSRTYVYTTAADGLRGYLLQPGLDPGVGYTLDELPGSPFAAGPPDFGFGGIAVTGDILIAASARDEPLSSFRIRQDGSLTPLIGSAPVALAKIKNIAVTPDGRLVFAIDEGHNLILRYNLNRQTGELKELTPRAGPGVPSVTGNLLISKNSVLFVFGRAGLADGVVRLFRIHSNGALTAVHRVPLPIGVVEPRGLQAALSPDNQLLAVAGSFRPANPQTGEIALGSPTDEIRLFSLNPVTGALTFQISLDGPRFATGILFRSR